MIRWLYDIEDHFFYASLPGDSPASQRRLRWSQRFGQLGDILSARTLPGLQR
jgi:hypothetical protein